MARKLVVVAIGLAVLLITPYFLWDEGDVGYAFGEAEMRAAVEGTWVATLVSEQGAQQTIAFTIEQAGAAPHSSREGGWIRRAAACDHRSFVKSAEACIDVSEMALTLVAIDGQRSSGLTGTLFVMGRRFVRGQLKLAFGNRGLLAEISHTGEVLEVDAHDGTARLERFASPAGGAGAAPRS